MKTYADIKNSYKNAKNRAIQLNISIEVTQWQQLDAVYKNIMWCETHFLFDNDIAPENEVMSFAFLLNRLP